jgi:hypothetical protein
MLNAYEHEPHFLNLLAGKTSIDFLPQIQRLIEKGWLLPPGKITPSFVHSVVSDDLQKFIVHAIM